MPNRVMRMPRLPNTSCSIAANGCKNPTASREREGERRPVSRHCQNHSLEAPHWHETMVISKPKKSEPIQDIENLKSDVASFASSLGLSSSSTSAPTSGFDDSDFRKTGRLKPNFKPPPKNQPSKQPKFNVDAKPEPRQKAKANGIDIGKERPKPRVFQPLSADNPKWFDKFKNLPKLPLVKASSLGVWHHDAAELEEKVIGSETKRKKVEFRDVEEWKRLVEKNKELAGRLLAQYTQDYESSRGQNGDIKMLVATQRSGTAADKVSAFSVMVGENPIANLRSLDALLGNFLC